MEYYKKSLGQNFLIDKNIINKIVNTIKIKNKNILEIGSGKGALTDSIIEKKPKTLLIVEKDNSLAKELKMKYKNLKNVFILNEDILKINIEKKIKKKTIVFGNLPYNISSQILIKFIKFKTWPPNFDDLIFMFQKELGDKISSDYPSKHYGRISVICKYRMKIQGKFLVSQNSFFPKPKVNSIVIHFKPQKSNLFKIKKIENLEKITNIIFSNKRKMINKSIKKLFKESEVPSFLSLKKRPAEIKPEHYYKLTNLYESG